MNGNLFEDVDKGITGQVEAASADAVKETIPPSGATPGSVETPGQSTPVPNGVVTQAQVDEAGPPSFIEPKADLICGATGSGKTASIGDVADYVLAKYGKLTRIVGADPGGFGPLKGMVDSGQIEYWSIKSWKKPIDALYKATHGWWPLDPGDPDSPLVASDAGTYEVYGFEAYEGLTSIGDMILDSLGDDKAQLSQSPSYTWKQGDTEFSGGNESYYGFLLKELARFVWYSHSLKFEKVLWTALETKFNDKGAVEYGPMIAGKKAGPKAGAWFCNFFHLDMLMGAAIKDEKTGQSLPPIKRVLFLKPHVDPLTLVPFMCKVRPPKAYDKEVPAYLESGNIADAYRLLDTLWERQAKDSAGRMNEIKGLKDRLIERAVKAREAEKLAAEKRAKAANLLKPMVTVPAMPVAKGPIGSPVTAAPATSVAPAAVVIQNVRKPKG